jgi:salicylate hydroxylase
VLKHFPAQHWSPQARSVIAAPDRWLKWALNGHRPLQRWSRGAVAVLGDAAHAMLPFLAQGGAMAIEDAAVVARCLAQNPNDPAAALSSYSAIRRGRAARVQRLAMRNNTVYHLGGLAAVARDSAMRMMGGSGLLAHYDWLYDWRPPPALALTDAR